LRRLKCNLQKKEQKTKDKLKKFFDMDDEYVKIGILIC